MAKVKVTKVHIGEDVYIIGRSCCSIIERDKYLHRTWHRVIYKNGKTFSHYYENDFDFGDTAKTAVPSNAKIFILTHILDNKMNWVFDLDNLPKNGNLKVIYNNGTVRNIEFNGVFEPALKYKGDIYILV